MPLTRLAADALDVLSISLVALTALLGLFCIFLTLHFQFYIQRQRFPQLSFFNGPWITRVILILVVILWGFGETVRLNFARARFFSSKSWQQNACKFYLLSNIGFAEPSMYLMLAFLLNAALQKRESGTLSRRWNRKTLAYVLFFCFPIFCMQVVLVLVGPKLNNDVKRKEMAEFFTCYSSTKDEILCTYPLVSTIVLGVFYTLLISYITYTGTRLSSLVINKGLRKRINVLILAVFVFLPLRAILLGFSVLPNPGNSIHKALVFLAFIVLLVCTLTGICILVYFPVTDSLALRDVGHIEIEGTPYDDYYYDGASLLANQSLHETSRNSDASSKQGSMLFCPLTKLELPASSNVVDVRVSKRGLLNGTPSPVPQSIPMVPLTNRDIA